jgi:hypothetical protein
MNMKVFRILAGTLSLALTTGLAAIAAPGTLSPKSGTVTNMEPAALEFLKSVSEKLGAAQTIQVEAEHKLDPALGLGIRADNGPINLDVKRPNRFYAIQPAGNETREIAYDGSQLCVMYPAAKHYALETLKAKSIEQFAQVVEERFGFRPPVAELLADDMAAELLIDVTSARLLAKEEVGGATCEHLRLEQEGMTTDLWVSVEDKLPRRMLTTVTDLAGHPTWDISFSKWELDGPLDEGLFSKRPASESQKVQMIKSQ